MDMMYGLQYIQVERKVVVMLPNGVILMQFILPTDNRDDLDFDVIHNVCVILAERVGLLELNISKLKKFKMPQNVRVVIDTEGYKIYINGNMLIGIVSLERNAMSAKSVVGLSIVLNNRWKQYIKNMKQGYKIANTEQFK